MDAKRVLAHIEAMNVDSEISVHFDGRVFDTPEQLKRCPWALSAIVQVLVNRGFDVSKIPGQDEVLELIFALRSRPLFMQSLLDAKVGLKLLKERVKVLVPALHDRVSACRTLDEACRMIVLHARFG